MLTEKVIRYYNKLVLCKVIRDRNIYDTEVVVDGSSSVQFFKTLQGKDLHRANFEGDKAIVSEGYIFQVLKANAIILGQPQDIGTLKQIFDNAQYEIDVNQVEVVQEHFRELMGGIDHRLYSGGANPDASIFGVAGDATNQTCRKYLMPKHISGGRQLNFNVRWPESGGLKLFPSTKKVELMINLYGMELVPVEQQPNRNQLDAMFRSQQALGVL